MYARLLLGRSVYDACKYGNYKLLSPQSTYFSSLDRGSTGRRAAGSAVAAVDQIPSKYLLSCGWVGPVLYCSRYAVCRVLACLLDDLMIAYCRYGM